MVQKSKLELIQGLRFLAAILVVFFHIHMHYRETEVSLMGDFFRLGSNGVDIFFVLSGFIIFYTLKGTSNTPLRFILKRSFRILPSYWLLLLLPTIALQILGFSDKHPELMETPSLIQAILLTPNHQQIGPSWTLSYELFFYLIVFISLIFRSYGKLMFLLFLLPLLTLIQIIPDIEGLSFFQNPISLEFLMGIIVFKLSEQQTLPKVQSYIILGISTTLFIVNGLYSKFAFVNIPVLCDRAIQFGIPSLGIVYSLICIERNSKVRLPSWILTLGAASYSLYLTHAFVVSYTDKIAFKLSDNPLIINLISISGVAIATFISVLAYKLIEYPVIKFLYKLLNAKPISWNKK